MPNRIPYSLFSALLLSALLADLYIQALDLLVEGRERNVKLLGGVGLIPVATLQLLDDDAALDVFESTTPRSIEFSNSRTLPGHS